MTVSKASFGGTTSVEFLLEALLCYLPQCVMLTLPCGTLSFTLSVGQREEELARKPCDRQPGGASRCVPKGALFDSLTLLRRAVCRRGTPEALPKF